MAVLQKLRELTEKLPVLGPSDYTFTSDDFRTSVKGTVDYNVESGSCVGRPLLHDSICAVQSSHLSAGTMFPPHTHEEIEVLIITLGTAEYYLDGEKPSRHRASTGDTITFMPGVVHAFRAITPVELIGITIPASECYPKISD